MSDRNSRGTWHTCAGRSRSRCFLCWTLILKGDRYQRSTAFSDDGGRPWTILEHQECRAALEGLGYDYFHHEEGIPERCLSGEYVADEELPAEFVVWRDRRRADDDQ